MLMEEFLKCRTRLLKIMEPSAGNVNPVIEPKGMLWYLRSTVYTRTAVAGKIPWNPSERKFKLNLFLWNYFNFFYLNEYVVNMLSLQVFNMEYYLLIWPTT